MQEGNSLLGIRSICLTHKNISFMPSFSYQFYETMFENKQSLINSFTFWTAPESIYSFITMDQFMIFQRYKVGIICSVNTKKNHGL